MRRMPGHDEETEHAQLAGSVCDGPPLFGTL
jgi:hypothetical protein